MALRAKNARGIPVHTIWEYSFKTKAICPAYLIQPGDWVGFYVLNGGYQSREVDFVKGNTIQLHALVHPSYGPLEKKAHSISLRDVRDVSRVVRDDIIDGLYEWVGDDTWDDFNDKDLREMAQDYDIYTRAVTRGVIVSVLSKLEIDFDDELSVKKLRRLVKKHHLEIPKYD